jgi:hypothetical protein
MRERKDFKRISGVRDARLFVVATEGEQTEARYFEQLVSEDYYYSSRVHLEIIPAEDGKSAPKHVIARLDEFRRSYKLRKGDELWILIDRDHRSWNERQLATAQQLCKQKNYRFGLTNPSFELWLILHLCDVPSFPPEERESIRENRRIGSRTYCEGILVRENGSYNKVDPDLSRIISNVELALDRNKRLTQNHSVDLFTHIGSTIDLLIESLIEKARQ